MKNYWLLILLSFFIYNESWSQCTPVDCPGAPSLLPFGGICGDVIPTGMVNAPYIEQESFRLTNACFNPADFDSTQISIIVKILHIRAFSFSGLPSGLTAVTDQAQYNTGSTPTVGCVSVSGTPTEAGLFAATIDVTAKLRSWLIGGCNGILNVDVDQPFSFSLDLIILPDPSFSGLSASYCDNDASVTLTSTGTTGGTFSGPGVSGTTFDPAIAGPGTHQVIYTVSAQEGLAVSPATNADTVTVTIHPTYEITIDATTCNPGSVGTDVQNLTTGQGCDSTVTTISVLDNTPPTALCQDLTIQLDAGAGATITTTGIDNGSNDTCGVSLAIDTSSFGCAELGANTVTLTVTDGAGNSNTCTATVTVEDPLNACNPCPDTQSIPITAGWSIISSYIQPDNPDMLTVLQDVSSDIILLKDASGSTVIPAIGFYDIEDWLVTKGYRVKASSANVLSIGCTQVDPASTPISLASGWDIIPYLRDDAMDVEIALASLGLNLIIAKDDSGNVFIPILSINDIGDLQPGKGYQVKLSSPGTLTFPSNTVRVPASSYTAPLTAERYRVEGNTGNNATIIIPEGSIDQLKPGDEIGVFNSHGELSGSAVYNGGALALTAWGNDPTVADGRMMTVGGSYNFKVWRQDSGEEMNLLVEYGSGDTYFKTDGLSFLSKGAVPALDAESKEARIQLYPNPVSTELNMDVWVSETTQLNLQLFNVAGSEMGLSKHYKLNPGASILKVDLGDLPAGEYFYRLTLPDELFNGSFIKIK